MFKRLMVTILILTGGLISAPVFAEPTPTADLLLPYFEVDLSGFKRTTLFTVTNNDPERSVDVEMVVHTNWGIPLETVKATLEPKQTRGYNLRDWLRQGELPQPDGALAALAPRRLAHIQSALLGQKSPVDQMYYGTVVLPDLAVGYVTIRAVGSFQGNVLWGNFFIIDPQDDSAQGDVLVDINPRHECHDLCTRHLLFFLEGNVFDGGTELVIWNPGKGQPQASAEASVRVAGLDTVVRDLNGEVVFSENHDLLATQTLTMEEVVDFTQSGTMELETTGTFGNNPLKTFIGIRYGAEHRYSAVLQSWCEPVQITGGDGGDGGGDDGSADDGSGDDGSGDDGSDDGGGDDGGGDDGGGDDGGGGDGGGPDPIAIDIEKATNGFDADDPTGPKIPVGDPVYWTYVVTNTGAVTLFDVTVEDNEEGLITCPKTILEPDEQMTCEHQGVASEGQYANVAMVSGHDALDRTALDDDPSHYFGEILVTGDQGCTPGYWKNHTDSWPAAGFSPGQSLASVFSQAGAYPELAAASMIEALDFGGGPGVEGAARNLMRAAVASLLDASHPGVDYPRTPTEVVSQVNSALASGDRATMLAVASSLDQDNNLGCPLN